MYPEQTICISIVLEGVLSCRGGHSEAAFWSEWHPSAFKQMLRESLLTSDVVFANRLLKMVIFSKLF